MGLWGPSAAPRRVACYGATVYRADGVAHDGIDEGCAIDVYRPLVAEIARFFNSGKPSVSPE
jgi:hypothetical protein